MSDQGEKPVDEISECFLCSKTDEQIALFHVLLKGKKQWVCAKCVPVLVHGSQ